MTVFVCTKCGLEKITLLFPKKGKQCKACLAEANRVYVEQNRARIQERKNQWQQIKRAKIKAQKPLILTPLQIAKTKGEKHYFTGKPCPAGHVANRSTRSRACVVCDQLRVETYKAAHRDVLLEKKRERAKQYAKENYAHVRAVAKKAYDNRSPEQIAVALKHAKAWRDKNKERVLSWTRKRQADKLQRTPAWLTEDDHWMIEQAYELASLRTEIFGFPWHVDHVLPLRGKMVSGLHVPTNLQVIPGVENLRKGNRL